MSEFTQYTVKKLKDILRRRGQRVTGNKAELISRIQESDLFNMEDSVQPNDSASYVGSYISSTSSVRAWVAARRAALMAQLEGEQRRAELEIERVNLEARLRLNEVKTSLRAATAEEEALEAYETGTVWDQGTADNLGQLNPTVENGERPSEDEENRDLQTRSTAEQHVPKQPADADRIPGQEGMNRQYLLGANKSVQQHTSTPQQMGQPSNMLPSVIPLSATTPNFHPQQQSNQYRSTIAGPDHTRITQPFVTETLQQQMFDVLKSDVSRKENLCSRCHQNHTLFHCEEFKKLSPPQKLTFAKENGLCFNCLKPGKHSARDCTKVWYRRMSEETCQTATQFIQKPESRISKWRQ